MSREFDAMVAGHLCIDIIPEIPCGEVKELGEALTPGKLVNAGPATIATGGAVSNTGGAMCKLGGRICLSSKVGDDDFGRIAMQRMQELGGMTDGIKPTQGLMTSYSVIVAVPGVDRIILHCPGSNDKYGPDDLDKSLLEKCRLFHFGYPPLMAGMYNEEGERLERLMEAVKASGVTSSMDMALPDPESPAGKAPWRKILKRTLPHVDIFLPSLEEALYMVDAPRFMDLKRRHGGKELLDCLSMEDIAAIGEELLSMGPSILALKCGYKGWYFRSRGLDAIKSMGAASPSNPELWADRELWMQAYRASSLKSATGAGDCSIAGFLTGLLNGMDAQDALAAASCLGWQNVQAYDALGGIKTWSETLEILKGPMESLEWEMDSKGWRQTIRPGLLAGTRNIQES